MVVGYLLIEIVGKQLEAHRSLERSTRQVVVLLVDGQLGLAHPFHMVLSVFVLFLFEQVLVGRPTTN
jgi:hypothetical protein